jgi:catechol 2,3-dioxygenase-like lactoylglutathione lyase family enzyme
MTLPHPFEGAFLIDHISLGTCHYGDAVAFYRRSLAALGTQLMRDTGFEAAFGTGTHWYFFLYPEAARVTAPGMHIALTAASRAQVAAVYEAALASAGTSLFSPRERPDISPSYFGAMFTDLDGHRVEVLTHAA